MKRKWTRGAASLDFEPGAWDLLPPLRHNPPRKRKRQETVQPRGDTAEEIEAAARRVFSPEFRAWVKSWH